MPSQLQRLFCLSRGWEPPGAVKATGAAKATPGCHSGKVTQLQPRGPVCPLASDSKSQGGAQLLAASPGNGSGNSAQAAASRSHTLLLKVMASSCHGVPGARFSPGLLLSRATVQGGQESLVATAATGADHPYCWRGEESRACPEQLAQPKCCWGRRQGGSRREEVGCFRFPKQKMRRRLPSQGKGLSPFHLQRN